MRSRLRRLGPSGRPGFTLIELLVVLVVVVIIGVGVVLPNLGRRGCGRQIKDSTQVRGIHQGMVLWAQNNSDRYPLPSLADAKGDTVALADGQPPSSKNTTANIVSLLIYNGFFSPEICVSPAEVNANIRVYAKYQYSEPDAGSGLDKKLALWDPAFTANFTIPASPGGFSYGHTLPAEARREKRWSNTLQSTEPILGNRGPEIASVAKGRSPTVAPTVKNPSTNTFLIHGGRSAWEGHIVYNDNSVTFEASVSGSRGARYSDSAGRAWDDVFFSDEPDDAAGTNAYPSIFTTAGETKSAFTAIWD